MKGLFKHFLLITLLVIHTSWGTVMAAKMLTAELTMDSPNSSISSEHSQKMSHNMIVTIDSSAENPCPNHTKNMTADTSGDEASMSHCAEHDCTTCTCTNASSSVPTFFTFLDNAPLDRSHNTAFLNTIFPDSPPSFILRPPIS